MSDEKTTVQRPVVRFAVEALPTFALVVEAGPAAGARFVIDAAQPSRVLLGQSPSCELRLRDPLVSRRHAAFEVSGGRLRVVDLGSKNGTLAGDVQIVDAYLSGGEILRVGGTTLRVERGAASSAPVLQETSSFGTLVGASAAMRRLYPLCARLAATDVPVIIEGETGTGKEVLAESLHAMGPRSEGPFVVFDCTAVPPGAVEHQLFGREAASAPARRGVFEQASGGTLLFDEIGELELAVQAKLLRAIERAEVRRAGAAAPIRTNVRVIAVTRRDLDREVQRGRFRDDLFHRLAVARVELPPLRRREGDVRLLAERFAQELGGGADALDADVLASWEEYAWPGNVRELRNAVVRRLALHDVEPPPEAPRSTSGAGLGWADGILELDLPLAAARERLIGEFERRYVERLVDKHGGNITKAAAASGVALRHFQRLRARHRDA